nr:hypothetical protein GCM10025732_33630 [Glycomyces mayteni]
MRPVGLRRTYDGWRLRTVGAAPNLPHVEVDLLLRDGDDRVDLRVRLEKERELAKEAVYVAFPFAATAPRFHYDRQQGWVDPAADHAPGACNEWFTTQYGVAVETAPGGPAVHWTSADAPLVALGDIVRGEWPDRFEPRSGAILSWVMNNYWPTNTPPEQDGVLDLHYSFTPAARFDPAAAGRSGRDTRFPGVAGEVNRLDKFDTGPRPLPADAASLLDLDLPPGVHATVAEPRDRDGLLIRLQDLTGNGADVPLPAGTAVRCRADETPSTPRRPLGRFAALGSRVTPPERGHAMRRRVLLGAGAALTGTALGGALTAAPAAAQTAAGPRAGTWGAAAYPSPTSRSARRPAGSSSAPASPGPARACACPTSAAPPAHRRHRPLRPPRRRRAVAAGTNKAVTFGGADTVVIAAGAVVLSDPIDLDLPAEADVAVSIHVPDVVADVTGHSIAAQRSYLTADGDHAAEESAAAFTEYLSKWYLLDEITVELDGPGGTVVCLGDSITDGVGSTSNLNRRWPDYLARRLLTADANTGVLNAGVSGNRVLWDGAAPSAQARLDRDVLSHPGVHAVVLLEAINDIASGKAAAPGDLLAAYAQIRERLAVHGVRLVLGTVTPWLGSASYTDAKEDIRVAVNTAIRAGTDPFIDFEAAVRDPENPKRLRAEYDSGGGVHPRGPGTRPWRPRSTWRCSRPPTLHCDT